MRRWVLIVGATWLTLLGSALVAEAADGRPGRGGFIVPPTSSGSHSFDILDAGQGYVANDLTVAKTLRAAVVDAGQLFVANETTHAAIIRSTVALDGTALRLTRGAYISLDATGNSSLIRGPSTGVIELAAGTSVQPDSDVLATLGTGMLRWSAVNAQAGQFVIVDAGVIRSTTNILINAKHVGTTSPNDAGTTAPACLYGREVLATNASIVSFNPAFTVLPACVCSHEAATPLACGPTAAATTTGVTFGVPAGSGTISWQCCGPR